MLSSCQSLTSFCGQWVSESDKISNLEWILWCFQFLSPLCDQAGLYVCSYLATERQVVWLLFACLLLWKVSDWHVHGCSRSHHNSVKLLNYWSTVGCHTLISARRYWVAAFPVKYINTTFLVTIFHRQQSTWRVKLSSFHIHLRLERLEAVQLILISLFEYDFRLVFAGRAAGEWNWAFPSVCFRTSLPIFGGTESSLWKECSFCCFCSTSVEEATCWL